MSWSVLDTTADRLLMFDRQSTEVWALALSGAHELRWSELVNQGESPPLPPSSGVYDPVTNSVLSIVHDAPYGRESANEVWALSLEGAPLWHRLNPMPSLPLREVDEHVLALDVEGRRLFVTGRGRKGCGTWSLDLEKDGAWTRLGDATPAVCQPAYIIPSDYLVYDAPRDRLVALGDEDFELPLSQETWRLLGRNPCSGVLRGRVHDAERERILVPTCHGTAQFSLTDDTWSQLSSVERPDATSASLDVARGRIVIASTIDSWLNGSNATWTLSLDSLEPSALTPNTRGEPLPPGASLVWDETREVVVSIGGEKFQTPTWTRTLDRDAAWTPSDFGRGPQNYFAVGAFDSASKAIFGFGGSEGGEPVWRLRSGDAQWQPLNIIGPSPRESAIVAYDSAEKRMLLRGGRPAQDAYQPWLDDVWSLSALDGSPVWTELITRGKSPGRRDYEAGILDPAGRQLILYGENENEETGGVLHALSLEDATWSLLSPSGTTPSFRRPQLVYDDVGQRVIFVVGGTHVVALELGAEPSWHTFCQPGLLLGWGSADVRVARVPDGLFVASSTDAYRFDLATPYCD
ncbi:MAG: hypothetical protein EOO73_27805 [Myxococcales bacterium]|nr:MAG: hypothetical protein EOO73_27805 [Myxococcales bacterium]